MSENKTFQICCLSFRQEVDVAIQHFSAFFQWDIHAYSKTIDEIDTQTPCDLVLIGHSELYQSIRTVHELHSKNLYYPTLIFSNEDAVVHPRLKDLCFTQQVMRPLTSQKLIAAILDIQSKKNVFAQAKYYRSLTQHHRQQKYSNCLNIMKQVKSEGLDSPCFDLKYCQILSDIGHLDKAKIHCEKYTAQISTPTSIALYVEILLKLSLFDQAEEILNQAISQYVTSCILHIRKGDLHLLNNQLELAKASYSQAIKHDHTSVEGSQRLASVFLLNDDITSLQEIIPSEKSASYLSKICNNLINILGKNEENQTIESIIYMIIEKFIHEDVRGKAFYNSAMLMNRYQNSKALRAIKKALEYSEDSKYKVLLDKLEALHKSV